MLIWQKFNFGIFDADGTLFDNMPLCANAFLEIVKNFNFRESPEKIRKIYLETNGMNLNDQFKLVFDKYSINPHTNFTKKASVSNRIYPTIENNIYKDNSKVGVGVNYNDALIEKLNKEFFALRDNSKAWQNAPLFPGIKTLLKNLKQNGIKNFVSSGSNTNEVIFRLKKAEILKYFDLILGAEKIPKGLKHIDLFANFCGIPPQKFASEAFLISDGPNDMALAKSTGIFAIGITNTVNAAKLKSGGADSVIKNIKQLLKLEF